MQVYKKLCFMYEKKLPPFVTEQRELIGVRLTELRKQKKLTQEDMAIKLGVTKSSINKMEKGVWISLEMLIRMSEILHFRIDLTATE